MATKEQPSPEQLEALESFKRSHGSGWKEDLANAWWTGRDASQPNGHLLRQIRNQFGPQWLANYRSNP